MMPSRRSTWLLLVLLASTVAPASMPRAAMIGRQPPLPALAVASTAAAPGVLWRFSTGNRPLSTGPAVGPDGTLYVAAGDGVLYAIAPDGRPRWSLATGVDTGAALPSRPAVGPDGTSYWNVRGSVVALDARGKVRWVFLSRGNGSPVLSRGRVLFAAGPYLYAIATSSAQAGQRVWRAAIGGSSTALQGPSPAVGLDGTAYVSSSDGNLYAISSAGLRRWAFHVGVPLQFSPAVGLDGTIYLDAFAHGAGTLYALTPGGRLRWRLTVPSGGNVTRGPDGTVYVAAHLLLAIAPNGRVRWRRVVDAAAPVATSGSLVLAPTLAPPALLALDARSGALRWRLPLPTTAVGPPAGGPAGRLYSSDYAGTLTAFAPGAHGGRLVRSSAHAAPAVDLGGNNPPFTVANGRVTWRVTVARTVERSADGGRHWQTVLSPGQSTPDPRTGRYRNARYSDVTFLAVDPHDPRGLYVGTTGALGDYLSGGKGGADGGLYYSANGLTGWRRLTAGLPYTYEPRLRVPTFGLDSLVFDPAHRGVLYTQTPVVFGSPGHDAGLYKSTDGGASWHEATRGLAVEVQGSTLLGPYRAFPPGALLVDRARTSVLFLIAPTGFYRSADAAAQWARVGLVRYTDPSSVAVRIEAGGAVRVYTDKGVYSSADYGAHWRRSS